MPIAESGAIAVPPSCGDGRTACVASGLWMCPEELSPKWPLAGGVGCSAIGRFDLGSTGGGWGILGCLKVSDTTCSLVWVKNWKEVSSPRLTVVPLERTACCTLCPATMTLLAWESFSMDQDSLRQRRRACCLETLRSSLMTMSFPT